MNEFLSQFGIDWKLFVSQLVNFALILIILRIFVYRPLIKMLNQRRDKIQEGLAKAEEAGIRLKEVDEIAKKKLKETEEKSVSILAQTDVKKKELESEAVLAVKKKEQEMTAKAEAMVESQKNQMFAKIQEQAAEIVRSAIAKGIEQEPGQIDEKLIKKTVSFLKNEL
ncbi:MAG: hypothetical protein WC845_02715 [Candidatus Staskawiczbacteria bacterium]|jgi:F-type H+-transporting ATPase subunit b